MTPTHANVSLSFHIRTTVRERSALDVLATFTVTKATRCRQSCMAPGYAALSCPLPASPAAQQAMPVRHLQAPAALQALAMPGPQASLTSRGACCRSSRPATRTLATAVVAMALHRVECWGKQSPALLAASHGLRRVRAAFALPSVPSNFGSCAHVAESVAHEMMARCPPCSIAAPRDCHACGTAACPHAR